MGRKGFRVKTAAFFAVGNIDRASSRYRVHYILPERENFIRASAGGWKKANVVVFQRAVDKRYRKIAEAAKAQGKRVVFDCSDYFFYRKWGMGGVRGMAKRADFMTTSNGDDRRLIEHDLKKKCFVVPNAQRPSNHIRKHTNIRQPIVVWVGRVGNMHTLGEVWPALTRLAEERVPFQVLLINDTGTTAKYSLPGIPVKGAKWNRDKVDRMLARCDLGINPQVRQSDGRYHKDNNKGVTMWRCGLPCICFNITKDWYGDIKRMLLDWRLRVRQGAKGVRRAREWEPQVIANKWEEVLFQ